MKISNSESLVMEALWSKSPLTAEEIVADLGPRQSWSEGTVKTLINRLLTKGAISAEKDGRRYLYRPLVERAEYLTAESEGLISRLFDGRLAPLVSHFSEHQKLTPQDISELKAMIERWENDR